MLSGRLITLLIVFAMLFAPIGIAGGHAAMAKAAAAHAASMEATEHCADQQQQQPSNGCGCVVDCTVAWSVLPDVFAGIVAQLIVAAPRQRHHPSAAPDGLHPESDPPPPRIA